ncbi:MAG TPA: type II secretion system protein [Gemmatimonadales bacterium]|jgi:prepilin-type N-terminal cleavage/methylation domain-containing protein|nr:type II secretion system protein [Gemmatimonadales bacterium]
MARRRGFTLIEMLIAIVILVVVATGVARFSTNFSRSMSDSAVRVVATGVANDRLETIRSDPRYTSLVALYGTGGGADTTGFADYPNMHRLTRVVRDQSGTPARDRTTITVQVTDPVFKDTVSVTAVIASP